MSYEEEVALTEREDAEAAALLEQSKGDPT